MALEFHTFQFPSDPCRPLRSWCSALAYRRYDKHLALVFPIQACTLCMESLLSSSRTQACIPCNTARVSHIQACTLYMESLLSSSRTQACIPCNTARVSHTQVCTLCMESLLSSSRTQACIPCTELFLYESPRPACRLCTQRPGSIAPSHSECS